MADISLGDLLALILRDLAGTVEQTTDETLGIALRVDDIDLEIPAYLYLPEAGSEAAMPRKLGVALPSTRETPAPGRIGRLRVSIQVEQGTGFPSKETP